MTRFLYALVLGLSLAAPLSACQKDDATPVTIERDQPVLDANQKEKFGFQRYFTRDRFDRRITFYLSTPPESVADKKLPLVVCVQGSGSQSIFIPVETPDGTQVASGGPESVVRHDFEEQVRVLVVEKPGVTFLEQPSQPGGATEASAEYNREFSLERWVEAVSASVRAVQKLDEIDLSRLMVLGHSEGGQVACEVAAANPAVTHVAVMAGGGPTQLFDLIVLARNGDMYNPEATPQERVDSFLADWQKVLDEPLATDKFILGHSHLRWSSFLKSSPIEAILKTKAKVFVAQGTEDTNSLPASAEVLYSELLARGRDCVYERVEGGDHGFMTAGDNGKGWVETHSKAVNWFLGKSPDQTSITN